MKAVKTAKTPGELLFYTQRPPLTLDGSPIQSYFPSLEQLFPSVAEMTVGTPTLGAKELAVDVSDGVALIENLQDHTTRTLPIWIRKCHLVDPIDVMSGDQVLPGDGSLPYFREAWQSTLRKLNDPYNEAYTDAVFACMASRLVETGRSPHFCRFFGTGNARTPEYRYDITSDMVDIEDEDWFREGLRGGAFKILAVDPEDKSVFTEMTYPMLTKPAPRINDASTSSSVSGDESIVSEEESEDDDEAEIEEADIEASGEAVIHRPQIQLARRPASHTSESEESDYSEDDVDYVAVLRNFPVQLTVLERCDGTMDRLMVDENDQPTTDMLETKEQRWTAWIFQVIAGLVTAQQAYDFVHNDLHTNNVMWVGTGETHLYYHLTGVAGGDRFYRVPTYGRIMKIIDFGRATFRPKSASTDNRLWLPDAFSPEAVAGGQYNCGPYFEKGSPKVSPNKSFDLCRLAVAILDTLWWKEPAPIEPKKVLTKERGRTQYETTSPLWNLMWLWLTDRRGENILRGPDDRERYPQFDLYCAIARDAVNAVPVQQLTLPLFDGAFRCAKKDVPADATIWKLSAK
jgi:hypothetical protein